MPRGDKSSYTDKQKRQAEHIEKSYEAKGVGAKKAAARAWATVNKQDHGGKKSGSGRKATAAKTSRAKSTRAKTTRAKTTRTRTRRAKAKA